MCMYNTDHVQCTCIPDFDKGSALSVIFTCSGFFGVMRCVCTHTTHCNAMHIQYVHTQHGNHDYHKAVQATGYRKVVNAIFELKRVRKI